MSCHAILGALASYLKRLQCHRHRTACFDCCASRIMNPDPPATLGALAHSFCKMLYIAGVLIAEALGSCIWLICLLAFMIGCIAFTGAHMQKHDRVTRLLVFNHKTVVHGLRKCFLGAWAGVYDALLGVVMLIRVVVLICWGFINVIFFMCNGGFNRKDSEALPADGSRDVIEHWCVRYIVQKIFRLNMQAPRVAPVAAAGTSSGGGAVKGKKSATSAAPRDNSFMAETRNRIIPGYTRSDRDESALSDDESTGVRERRRHQGPDSEIEEVSVNTGAKAAGLKKRLEELEALLDKTTRKVAKFSDRTDVHSTAGGDSDSA